MNKKKKNKRIKENTIEVSSCAWLFNTVEIAAYQCSSLDFKHKLANPDLTAGGNQDGG